MMDSFLILTIANACVCQFAVKMAKSLMLIFAHVDQYQVNAQTHGQLFNTL